MRVHLVVTFQSSAETLYVMIQKTRQLIKIQTATTHEMLRRFEICFCIDIIDCCIMTDRSTEISMTSRWYATFTEDNRDNKDENNHRDTSNSNTNE